MSLVSPFLPSISARMQRWGSNKGYYPALPGYTAVVAAVRRPEVGFDDVARHKASWRDERLMRCRVTDESPDTYLLYTSLHERGWTSIGPHARHLSNCVNQAYCEISHVNVRSQDICIHRKMGTFLCIRVIRSLLRLRHKRLVCFEVGRWISCSSPDTP